jgi:hypothetical protein
MTVMQNDAFDHSFDQSSDQSFDESELRLKNKSQSMGFDKYATSMFEVANDILRKSIIPSLFRLRYVEPGWTSRQRTKMTISFYSSTHICRPIMMETIT